MVGVTKTVRTGNGFGVGLKERGGWGLGWVWLFSLVVII